MPDVRVWPESAGDSAELTGRVTISVRVDTPIDTTVETTLTLGTPAAREMFGRLGDALRAIDEGPKP